jgi:hypothetical protein
MTDVVGIAMYRLCELSYGKDAGFAGFVSYKAIDPKTTNLDAEIQTFLAEPANIAKQPRRRSAGTTELDPPLTIVSEPGKIRYVIVIDQDAESYFDSTTPIFALPIGGPHHAAFIDDVSAISIAGKTIATSFVIDSTVARQSPLAKAIGACEHNGALRIPIYYNLIDDAGGFPQAVIDDHRFPSVSQFDNRAGSGDHDHDHDHEHEHEHDIAAKKITNHGGAHPPTSARMIDSLTRINGFRTHGGAHPPGIASYIVVELP